MKEDLLHYIWKYKKYPISDIRTTAGDAITVQNSGTHNELSGPDFFNARLVLDDQLWAGNVEIHIKSSDWYAHGHETDLNYDNVILHVVWEEDVSVFRADGSEIPTLELKKYLDKEVLFNYKKLFEQKTNSFINCGTDINAISAFSFANWKERLYFERLERKSDVVLQLLESSNNDWEKVLFVLCLKSFGSKINGDAFYELGKRIDFSIVRKLRNKPMELEALFLGMAGLLDKGTDTYQKELRLTYQFLVHKYQLEQPDYLNVQFFKLRPSNFPTIRLAQFAQLYASEHSLFQRLIQSEGADLYQILAVKTSAYWETHYTFGKVSKKMVKRTSHKFIDLLIINTVLPLKFSYFKYQGRPITDAFLNPILKVPAEANSIIKKYEAIGLTLENAKDSQSLLELYANYCSKNKCLQCAVGSELLTLKT